MKKLLIANRGEIAIRIIHSAAELGLKTAVVYSQDDARSLHTRKADEAHALSGRGVAAYLDQEELVALALRTGCDAVHPGYGFLSENAGFARRCVEAGLTFVGPDPETLDLFGDKSRARALAAQAGVPVLAGTDRATSLDEARAFLESMGPGGAIMVKAIAGGGGRGIRAVTDPRDLEEAYEACRSEAERAFGLGDVYVERFMPRARHIEVQVVGDGTGAIAHLWERECSVQRRNQKLVEIAPAPGLDDEVRERLLDSAVTLARAARYRNLGTFEFLVDASPDSGGRFAFIEANARLQVEHTVTEQVTGFDLVRLQLQIAEGRGLSELGLEDGVSAPPRGIAMQLRVNMERMDAEGNTKPSGGVLSAFEIPFGPGVRVDTCGYVGYRASPAFDSLLAKVICHTPSVSLEDVAARAYRALCEFRIDGVETNLPFLQTLLTLPDFRPENLHTRFLEERLADVANGEDHRKLFFELAEAAKSAPERSRSDDPLAVLDFGRASRDRLAEDDGGAGEASPSEHALRAPMQGTIISVHAEPGQVVPAGHRLLVMEAMKMQHSIRALSPGTVLGYAVQPGDTVYEDDPLLYLEPGEGPEAEAETEEEIDLDHIRPDLRELIKRRTLLTDEARPDAVARRRKTGQRTTRENIADLCDGGSFVEYGGLAIAAQRSRRPLDELIRKTPADGLVTGIATVNAEQFGPERSRCAVLSYDYTVLAGTQGKKNHDKTDRMLEVAANQRLPIVFFTEGGGGRPGDTDVPGVAGLHVLAFNMMAKMSGLVPLVGVTSGRCFAGNAALLGCCDVIIATRNSTIGMGGPAMIEGGGLGIFTPEEVGPMSVQVPNGVVDIAVEDEEEAVAAARQYLGYFQGRLDDWECADQRLLRRAIPENRLEVYDVRQVIATLADIGSMLELRKSYGPGMVTAFIRVEGRPIGVVANNPLHLSGAIDSPGADKAARFLQLCDAFDIPVLFLCDTPGMMVGPEVEKTALVRHCSRLFVTGANLTVPFFTIVLRKSYGLGAQAMAGGSFRAPLFAVAWPTGEFGGMGIEGAVKLGFRNDLTAIEDPAERKAKFDEMVAMAYDRGKAISTASFFELDDVIDPAESRARIMATLNASPPPLPRAGKKRPNIDTW